MADSNDSNVMSPEHAPYMYPNRGNQASGRLEPALIVGLRTAILSGFSNKSATELCHIHHRTLDQWLWQVRKDLLAGQLGINAKLVTAIEVAPREFELEQVNTLREAPAGGLRIVPVLAVGGREVLDDQGKPKTTAHYERPRWEAAAFLLKAIRRRLGKEERLDYYAFRTIYGYSAFEGWA